MCMLPGVELVRPTIEYLEKGKEWVQLGCNDSVEPK